MCCVALIILLNAATLGLGVLLTYSLLEVTGIASYWAPSVTATNQTYDPTDYHGGAHVCNISLSRDSCAKGLAAVLCLITKTTAISGPSVPGMMEHSALSKEALDDGDIDANAKFLGLDEDEVVKYFLQNTVLKAKAWTVPKCILCMLKRNEPCFRFSFLTLARIP
ncbi:hypothetical protein IW262DRAFT_1299428 [Armillaria fumosa]|nr:hypothetical protein IW262DRAFT_1299428 [Armillaria fumosa]